LKRLKNQKLLHISKENNDYKIWIDVKIILNKLLQTMIDLKATNNYILHEAVQWLELILQWWRNSAYVYIINVNSMIVWNYIYMKMIIKNVSQKLLFNILNIKYDAIVKMLWLCDRNFKIDWINKKLCMMKHTYEISEQSEMCLSEYKLWNHKILLLKKKQFKWMSLYFMSENQLKKLQNYLDKNLKREFIKSLKSSTDYLILFVSKKDEWKQLYVNYQQLNAITRQDSYSLSLIEKLQNQLKKAKYFTNLDLKDVYYWVKMKEDKKWKMTFWTRYKHYEYIIMSFELKNTSVIF